MVMQSRYSRMRTPGHGRFIRQAVVDVFRSPVSPRGHLATFCAMSTTVLLWIVRDGRAKMVLATPRHRVCDLWADACFHMDDHASVARNTGGTRLEDAGLVVRVRVWENDERGRPVFELGLGSGGVCREHVLWDLVSGAGIDARVLLVRLDSVTVAEFCALRGRVHAELLVLLRTDGVRWGEPCGLLAQHEAVASEEGRAKLLARLQNPEYCAFAQYVLTRGVHRRRDFRGSKPTTYCIDCTSNGGILHQTHNPWVLARAYYRFDAPPEVALLPASVKCCKACRKTAETLLRDRETTRRRFAQVSGVPFPDEAGTRACVCCQQPLDDPLAPALVHPACEAQLPADAWLYDLLGHAPADGYLVPRNKDQG